MAEFSRSHLFLLAQNAGWQRGQMTPSVRTAIRKALRDFFRTNEGRSVLDDAPRAHVAERGEDKHRRMAVKDAVDLLMEELET